MVSIIIPSYKGANVLEKNIPEFIHYLQGKAFEFEIIVVDDGSNDNGATKRICETYNCVYLENPKNMGKGAAVRRGMLNSSGEYKIFTDFDIPFTYDAIEKFFYYLDFKEFDIVIGDRTLSESSYFADIPPMRKLASKTFSFLVGRFFTSGLFDTQCGIKGFKAAVANDIFSKSCVNGFTFDVEVLYIALKRNYDIKRLPVQIRQCEESSISLLKHSPLMFLDILRMKYYHVIGKYNNK